MAPYEADAQLAYLNRSGIAQLIITEDSDLVLFGCDRVRMCIACILVVVRSIVINLSVCASVCLSASISLEPLD